MFADVRMIRSRTAAGPQPDRVTLVGAVTELNLLGNK